MVLGDEGGPHHVWQRHVSRSRSLAYIIVRDDAIETRRRAAQRLDRRLGGAPPSQQGGAFRPTPFQRRRLNLRSEEHTSELQSLIRIPYAVFCLQTQTQTMTKKTLTS